MIIGWRGYGGKPNDAPEHWVMGEKTKDYFKMININFKHQRKEYFNQLRLHMSIEKIKNEKNFLVRIVRDFFLSGLSTF